VINADIMFSHSFVGSGYLLKTSQTLSCEHMGRRRAPAEGSPFRRFFCQIYLEAPT
jgi:hypothetical protein